VYDGSFALSRTRRATSASYRHADSRAAPGLPFSLVFRAEPGKEDVILKVASAYQNASKRRVSPRGSHHVASQPDGGEMMRGR